MEAKASVNKRKQAKTSSGSGESEMVPTSTPAAANARGRPSSQQAWRDKRREAARLQGERDALLPGPPRHEPAAVLEHHQPVAEERVVQPVDELRLVAAVGDEGVEVLEGRRACGGEHNKSFFIALIEGQRPSPGTT